MPEVADVFRHFGKTYLEKFGRKMPNSHLQAFESIINCQTHNLGGSIHYCRDCSYEHYIYHSCKDRSCPKCHTYETDQWVNKLSDKVLPTSHFHIIFTLPSELRDIMRASQKLMYSVLMKSAFTSLQKLSCDERFAGGKIGAVAVLHTWSASMTYHPHVHFMVPGGALSKDKSKWIRSNKKYFVPVGALSKIFRAVFMKAARKELPEVIFPESVWEKQWGIYSKSFYSGSERLLDYLGRYVHRIAITNRRIISITDNHVIFKAKEKTIKVTGEEFIRRFLQHVLPKGFHKVRYFGIMHHANKTYLNQVKLLFAENVNSKIIDRKIYEKRSVEFKCPKCGCIESRIKILRRVELRRRGPP